MPTLYLIFGHLVADFMLQPAELVRWKNRSWKGTAVHALIHCLLYVAVFIPYWLDAKVLVVLLSVAFTHFIIDILKTRAEKRSNRYFYLFMVDQACHMGMILLCGIVLGTPSIISSSQDALGWYVNGYIVAGLSLMIVLSYTVEIIKYQLKRQKHDLTFVPNYGSMFKRVLIFTLLYAAFMIFGVYQTAAWMA